MVKFDNILDSEGSAVYKLRVSIQFKDGKYISVPCSDMCVLSGDYGFYIPNTDDYKDISRQLISKGVSFFENIQHLFIPSASIQFMSIFIEKT